MSWADCRIDVVRFVALTCQARIEKSIGGINLCRCPKNSFQSAQRDLKWAPLFISSSLIFNLCENGLKTRIRFKIKVAKRKLRFLFLLLILNERVRMKIKRKRRLSMNEKMYMAHSNNETLFTLYLPFTFSSLANQNFVAISWYNTLIERGP